MILIDWETPGMDDMETVRHIREIVGKATTPIAMSACDWREMEAPARTAGVDYFINKPVLREHLRDMLLVVTHHRHAFDVPAMPEEVRFNREKILIAEDNDLNAEILKTLLESRNLSVVWAEKRARLRWGSLRNPNRGIRRYPDGCPYAGYGRH